MIITSRANPSFKKLLALRTSRGIEKHSEFIVAGEKILSELLADNTKRIMALIRTPKISLPQQAFNSSYKIEELILSQPLFNEINVFGVNSPLALLKTWELEDFSSAYQKISKGCILFVPLADPENVGAVIRSAAALGAAAVTLFKEAASPFLPKAVRSSAGALWQIHIFRAGSIKTFLPLGDMDFYVLDMSGESITNVKPIANKPFGLLCGMEGQGVPSHLLARSKVIKIPMKGKVESLNAAVSVSIALWELRNYL